MSNKFWPSRNQQPEGCYRPLNIDEARADNHARAVMFDRDVKAYIAGTLSKEEIFRAFNAPIYGAFGEKL